MLGGQRHGLHAGAGARCRYPAGLGCRGSVHMENEREKCAVQLQSVWLHGQVMDMGQQSSEVGAWGVLSRAESSVNVKGRTVRSVWAAVCLVADACVRGTVAGRDVTIKVPWAARLVARQERGATLVCSGEGFAAYLGSA